MREQSSESEFKVRVEAHVQDGTAYLRKHMGEALLQLETDGELNVAENKTDGKKRQELPERGTRHASVNTN